MERSEADIDIKDLLIRGGMYRDIKGATYSELFASVCDKVSLPSELTSSQLYKALCQRESISTTAVGNGIAIPHSRVPLFKNSGEQRIIVCYLDEPVDMGAVDHRKVYVMFLVLTSNMQSHMQVISKIADFLKRVEVRKALEEKTDISGLLNLL